MQQLDFLPSPPPLSHEGKEGARNNAPSGSEGSSVLLPPSPHCGRGGAGGGAGSRDPAWLRWLLTLGAFAVIGVLIVVPVVNVFVQAFANGVGPYIKALTASPDTRH